MEGCGGSGEGEAAEAPDLVGEKVRSFQVMRMEAWGIGTAPRHVAISILVHLIMILSTHLRKSLWLMYLEKMCRTHLLRKILRASCSDPEFRRNKDFAQK